MSMRHLLLIILIAVLAAWGTVKLAAPAGSAGQGAHKEAAYERVMRTGTVRCGYYIFPPMASRDLKTGKMSGIAVDLLDNIGEAAHLKFEWVEEVSFGNMYEGLQTGRYDAICTPTWPDAASAHVANFTVPVFYSGTGAYVRADDHRFDGNLPKLNQSTVRISMAEGENVPLSIAKSDFPSATIVTLPQNADPSQVTLNVVTNKADVAFIDINRGNQFLKNNPGTLRNIAVNSPLRLNPFKMAVKSGEFQLQQFLSDAVEEQINTGFLDQILNKYDPAPHIFYRLARAYRPLTE